MNISTYEKLADASGVSISVLLGETAQSGSVPEVGNDLPRVPVFDLALSAGPGAWCEDDPQPAYMEPFDPRWLKRLTNSPPDRLMLVHVSGDSMEPTLHDGDQILIDRQADRVTRDGIYGLRLGADLLVKRVTVDPRSGRFTISSDNPRYDTYRDVAAGEVRIIGRVIWLGRRV